MKKTTSLPCQETSTEMPCQDPVDSIRSDQTLVSALHKLVDDSLWSNRKWIEFVYSEEVAAPHARQILGHLMVGERTWFRRIEGGPPESEMFPLLSKEELLRGFNDNRTSYLRIIESRLNEIIQFKRGSGEQYHARVMDIVHHLITHGYHHRGQLAAFYKAKGASHYPKTDHIFFLLENKL